MKTFDNFLLLKQSLSTATDLVSDTLARIENPENGTKPEEWLANNSEAIMLNLKSLSAILENSYVILMTGELVKGLQGKA